MSNVIYGRNSVCNIMLSKGCMKPKLNVMLYFQESFMNTLHISNNNGQFDGF